MHKRSKNSALKVLAILATIGILLVVMAGALVTKTGSGEGCGANWPLCHDQLFPTDPTLETVIEYTHRLVTGVVGILVLVFSSIMAIKYRKNREVLYVSFASIFFLLLQSALGALAVVFGQSSAILALHFGFSLLSFATLLLLCIYVFQLSKNAQLPTSKANREVTLAIFMLFIYTYIVVYIGAYVRHTGSSLACKGWPLCNGQVIPELSGQIGIHFGHRVAALLLFIGFVWLWLHVKNAYREDAILYRTSLILFAMVTLQVFSGAFVVLWQLHLLPSLLHAFIICVLFGVLSYQLLYVYRKNPK